MTSSPTPAAKPFYQKAASPVVVLPDLLVHHDVERRHQPLNNEPKPPFYIVDLPARSVCMTLGSLPPGALFE